MAISYVDTAWNTSGTAGTSVSYKEVTVTVAVGDLVVAVGEAADAAGAGTAALATQAGPGTTGSWTIGRSSNVSSNCGFVMGHATATGAGNITVRVTVPNSTPSSLPMGAGVWVVPAAEWTGTPAYTNLGPTDADGKVNVTLSVTSSVFYGGADWSAAGSPGTGTTPSGGVVDNVELVSGNYGVAVEHWTVQASGTRAYGPTSPAGNEFVGAVMSVEDPNPPTPHFPTIPTVAAGRVLPWEQATAVQNRNTALLSGLTKNAGDLLIVIFAAYQSSATANAVWSGWSAGWTEFLDLSSATGMAIGGAYKWSDGTESAVVAVTEANTVTGHAVSLALSIADAHPSTPPEASGTLNQGTTTTPSIPTLNPAGWDVEDVLWIVVAANGETSTTGAFAGVTAAPSGYSDFAATAISGDVVGGLNLAVAFKQATAASDGGTSGFTVDTSNARNCVTLLAVRPAPAVTNYNGGATPTATASATAAGVVGAVAGAALTAAVAITASGVVGTSSGASLTATSTITAAGNVSTGAASSGASLTAAGTITAAGVVGTSTTAAPTAAGTITAAGTVGAVSGAAVNAAGTITATGRTGTATGAALTATGTITATGVVGKFSSGTLTAVGTITADGSVTAPGSGSASLTAIGTITATGVVGTYSPASLPATVTITAAGVRGAVTGAAATAAGTITAAGTVGTAAGASATATGSITATGVLGRTAGATLTAAGTITAAGVVATGGEVRDVTVVSVTEVPRVVSVSEVPRIVSITEVPGRTVTVEEIVT